MGASRKRRGRYLFGLLLVPLSAWGLVVALAPTEWARVRVEAALVRSTRHPVRLGGLRLGLLGGVRLLNLEIGGGAGPSRPDDGPWLRAREVRLDLGLLQLLAGRVEPSRCRAAGVELRVLRRADGRLEIAELLEPDRQARPDPRTGGRDEAAPEGVALELAKARLLVLDEPTATRLELTEVEGRGTWEARAIEVEELTGRVNGGRLSLAARVDRAARASAFAGEVRVEGAGLDGALGLLGRLVPTLAESARAERLGGRLDLDVRLRGGGPDAEAIGRSLAGEGRIDLHDVALEESSLFAEVSRAFRVSPRDRVGSLRGEFVILERRVATRNLTLHLGPLPVRMAGWTDFEGRFDYLLRTDDLAARAASLARNLPPEYRESLADLPAALDQVTQIRLQGGPRGVAVTADGVRMDEWVRRARDPASPESRRLRELGRRFRGQDRMVR